jgi:hypothetical protein
MINEERMSVYVRLGIRLLYKGLKSRRMEKDKSKLRHSITSRWVAQQALPCCRLANNSILTVVQQFANFSNPCLSSKAANTTIQRLPHRFKASSTSIS